jgi:hypothetical protein
VQLLLEKVDALRRKVLMNRIIVKVIEGIRRIFRKPANQAVITPVPDIQAVIEPILKTPTHIREWQRVNPDKVKASVRKWNFAHPERIKEIKSDYRERNRPRIRAEAKEYHLENNEHINKIRRERYHRNKAKGE